MSPLRGGLCFYVHRLGSQLFGGSLAALWHDYFVFRLYLVIYAACIEALSQKVSSINLINSINQSTDQLINRST